MRLNSAPDEAGVLDRCLGLQVLGSRFDEASTKLESACMPEERGAGKDREHL